MSETDDPTRPADADEVIRLWPDGPPTPIETGGDEVAYLVKGGVAKGTHFLRNISDPTLTVFKPAADAGNGRGIVVAPGGGWTINAWSHEGLDVARWLTGVGYTAFLLKYRVQRSTPDQDKFEARWNATADAPLAARRPWAKLPSAISDLITTDSYRAARAAAAEDGREAIRVVRHQAGRFGVDPASVGMIGFSAGAFLTIDVALDPRDDPLAYVAAIYGGETNGTAVPADAPPLFSVVAQDDSLARIVEGLHTDWTHADRPSEHHVFARGAHGFGMVTQGLPSDRWTELFLRWLEDLD